MYYRLDPVKRAELLSSLQDIMSQAQQLRKRKLTNKEQKKIDESESDSFASSVSSDTGVEISDEFVLEIYLRKIYIYIK